MNKCIFIGRLGNEPEIRVTPSGTQVTSFSLAVARNYTNKDGNRDTDWLNCIAWDKKAEFISKYFHKGNKIALETEVQVRKYQDKNGNSRTAYDFNVLNAEFVESKNTSEDQETKTSVLEPPIDATLEDDDTLPF